MKKLTRVLQCGVLAGGLWILHPSTSLGEDRDSNTDAVFQAVATSAGALVRVPVNANGDEDTNAAELRVYEPDAGSTAEVIAASLPTVWEKSKSMELSTAAPADMSSDSSTSWWGWNRWSGYGWRQPYYYYNSYAPVFNYYGSYYNYYGYNYNTYPTYWNSYIPYNNYYGCRYYYYPRSY